MLEGRVPWPINYALTWRVRNIEHRYQLPLVVGHQLARRTRTPHARLKEPLKL